MEKYDVNNHLFYDGYNINQEELKSLKYISDFLENVNKDIFKSEGKITLIPYFNGKIEKDGGISGIILGNDFHFTCHTFCYKKTVFIDYYGENSKKELLRNIIFKTFKTDNYDLGSKDKVGNFGKHIIFETTPIMLDEAKNKVDLILNNIDMTPISKLLITEETNDKNFDVLQPIAESHISLHQHKDKLIIDVFSCKYFNEDKLFSLFLEYKNIKNVYRGLQYK